MSGNGDGNKTTAVATVEEKRQIIMPSEAVGNLAGANALISSMRGRLEQILPKHLTPERAMRVFQNAVSRNPLLLQCTAGSLQNAMITASEFGLEPNTPLGHCFMIPYKNGKTGKYEANFQMGYPGVLQLAYNSGRVPLIYAEAVHENDVFDMDYGLNRTLVHKPKFDGERGVIIGYYAVVQIAGYEPHFVYMTHAEIWAHAQKHSQAVRNSKKDSPWFSPQDSTAHQWMCKKTVLFQACKTAPKSIEDKWVKALTADDDMIPAGATVETGPRPGNVGTLLDRLESEAAGAAERLPAPGAEPEPTVDPETGEIIGDEPGDGAPADEPPAEMTRAELLKRVSELRIERGMTVSAFIKRFKKESGTMTDDELAAVVAALGATEQAAS
jgi:recombination protein RecT